MPQTKVYAPLDGSICRHPESVALQMSRYSPEGGNPADGGGMPRLPGVFHFRGGDMGACLQYNPSAI